MKTPLGITTVESRVLIPVSLLEQHVNSKHHPREYSEIHENNNRNIISRDFENIHWCSEELEVDGAVEIRYMESDMHRCISIPVTTGLLAVCTKGKSHIYRHTWSTSLS